MKPVVMLLMLAALGTDATPGPDCDGLNKTLPAEHMDKVSPRTTTQRFRFFQR